MDRSRVELILASRRSTRPWVLAARHLSVPEAVSYIDRTASARVLARLEHHLAHCDTCLREVIDVALFLSQHRGTLGGAGPEE